MAWGALLADFLGVLNRDDCTTDFAGGSNQAQTCLTQGFNKILRETEGKLFYLERNLNVNANFNQFAITTATVANGGSGYAPSATFTVRVVTNLGGGTDAQLSVTTNSAGVVTTVNGIVNAGVFAPAIASPASATGTGGFSVGSGLTLNVTSDYQPFNSVAVPTDLLSPIDIITPDSWGTPRALKHLPYRDLIRKDPRHWPRWYARFQGSFYWAGNTPSSQQMRILYYGTPAALAVNGAGNYTTVATNELIDNAFDLCLYQGLTFAIDVFNIDASRGAAWQANAQELLAAEVAKTVNMEWEGGPMQVEPAYGRSEDDGELLLYQWEV